MKFNLDKKYMRFSKYVIITAVIIYLLFNVIDSIPFVFDKAIVWIKKIIDICYPFIIGLIIAYLFCRPVRAIENFLMNRKHFPKKRGICRAVGIAVVYIGVLGIIIALICGIYFMIGGNISKSSTLSNIVNAIMGYFEDNSISTETISNIINKYNIPFGELIESQLGNVATFAQEFITALMGSIANTIISIGSNLFQVFVAMVLSIYLIASQEYFLDLWDKTFFVIFKESKSGRVIRKSLGIINETFSKYISGQLIEATIVAVMSSVVLLIVGVDYAVVIGIIAGVCNLIPYVGPFVGIILAGIIALFSGNLFTILGAVVGLTIVQQIDCNILAPKIVGDIVGLNAAFVLIAISVGGSVYGLLGMLIAVPVAASAKTLIGNWFEYAMKDKYEHYKKMEEVIEEDNNAEE